MNGLIQKRSSSILSSIDMSGLRHWTIQGLLHIDCITPHNAKTLLHELQLRLAVQHNRLTNWKDEMNTDVIQQFASNTTTTSTGTVRASIVPVSMIKEYGRRMEIANLEKQKATKCLKDLIQLHENTYILPQQILDGDEVIILNNFSKPNQRYVSDTFDQIMARHGTSVETLADAVISTRVMHEMVSPLSNNDAAKTKIGLLEDTSVESFLHSRLIQQLLCEHYVSLNKGKDTGAVTLNADVLDVVDDAVTEAKHVCDANLGIAPEVSKNAMTSNVERWNTQPALTKDSIPPSVHINLSREAGHLSVNVLDQGVGLNEQRTEKAFRFADSTSQNRWDRLSEQQSYAAVRQPLGSLGVGLPLSRLMMRVFGGDVELANRDGGVTSHGDSKLDSGCTATLKISYDDNFVATN
eukprot:g729.t1 g729   contig10:610000-611305(+)